MIDQSATAQRGRHATGGAAPGGVQRIALVGVHGFGEQHLANLARLEQAGTVELVAVADPNPPAPGRLAESVTVFDNLAQLLAADPGVDVVILATPIQTHAPLALAALSAGKDVYVEKPPVASLAQFREMLAAAETAGRLVQVGFQSFGSHALPAIRAHVASGGIGDILGVSARGEWVRSKAYFKRSRWAGKRNLDGTDVVDGVATNALAHAVATALHLAGAHTLADQTGGEGVGVAVELAVGDPGAEVFGGDGMRGGGRLSLDGVVDQRIRDGDGRAEAVPVEEVLVAGG